MSGDGAIHAAVCCGVVVVAGEPATILLLRRWAAMDLPGARSSHTIPTPRGGGLPIVIGLLAAAALTRGAPAVPFAAGVSFFGALGFADDLRGLTAMRRLALQCAGSAGIAALLVAPLGVPLVVRVAAAVVAAVWVMGFVNAFNFMDGVNGISASHALIGGVAFACFGEWHSDPFLVASGLAIAVGCLAFLPWNAFRAQVFLGDVGSYALGAALSILALTAVLRRIPPEAAAGPLALYVADTAWTLQRRIRAGERWIEPHRTHTYQRWCDVGWSHQEVTLMTASATVLLSLLGAVSLTGDTLLRAEADLTGLAILAVYLCSPAFFGHPALARERARPRHARRSPGPEPRREHELQRERG
jgi:UDP-N-acetylmuramyl pentapeptide phosphotransferase/UDP-N-acetylglucosamine-1-phosphate transferase